MGAPLMDSRHELAERQRSPVEFHGDLTDGWGRGGGKSVT